MDERPDGLSSIYDIAADAASRDPIDEFTFVNSSQGACRFQRQHRRKSAVKNDWDIDLDILDLDALLSDEPEESPAPQERPASRREEPAQHRETPRRAEPVQEDDLPDGIFFDTATLQPDFADSGEDSYTEDAEESYFAEETSFRGKDRPKGGRGGRSAPHRDRDGGEAEGAHAPAHRGRRREYDDYGDDDRSANGSRRGIPIHLILPIVIAIVLIIAVVRLVIWNRGTTIDTTTSENSFNVEVNDSMVLLSSSDLEGAADDGVTTILCLGNEPFSADTSASGLAGQIAALGDVEVINAAFPDSQVTCENETYTVDTLDDMDDIFNLFYVAYAISIDDYSSLATVASAHSDETYADAVEALQNTDFSAVDIIAIQYDGIDYINGMAMYNEDVPTELTTYVGSLTNSFALLRAAYPHIRIVFMSPWYAEYDGASSRTTDLGNGTIVDYFQWAYDTCGSDGISFLDNYYGSINENNFEEYLSDGVNLNEDGCTKIADHFVYKVIQGSYAEYNVDAMAVAE